MSSSISTSDESALSTNADSTTAAGSRRTPPGMRRVLLYHLHGVINREVLQTALGRALVSLGVARELCAQAIWFVPASAGRPDLAYREWLSANSHLPAAILLRERSRVDFSLCLQVDAAISQDDLVVIGLSLSADYAHGLSLSTAASERIIPFPRQEPKERLDGAVPAHAAELDGGWEILLSSSEQRALLDVTASCHCTVGDVCRAVLGALLVRLGGQGVSVGGVADDGLLTAWRIPSQGSASLSQVLADARPLAVVEGAEPMTALVCAGTEPMPPLVISGITVTGHWWMESEPAIGVVVAVTRAALHLHIPRPIGAVPAVDLAQHFRQLLVSAITQPQLALDRHALVTGAERQRMLTTWNETDLPFPQDATLHGLFEAQVQKTPQALAIVHQDTRLTYAELDARAEALASALQAQGVRVGDHVAMLLERDADLPVAMFGIIKCGASYVPIDPKYPQERISSIVTTCAIRVAVSQPRFAALLPEGCALVAPLAQRAARAWQRPTVGAELAAYVIHTSGSTGKPKGVAVSHRSAVSFMHWARSMYTPEDLALTVAGASICFDVSVIEFFTPLSWGGAVLILESALGLVDSPARDQVTMMDSVPSVVNELARTGAIPKSLRVLNLGGESLGNELAQRIYRQSSVQAIYNVYGPTEDTVIATFEKVERGGSVEPTIGRPIGNHRCYILDSHLQPVPVGVTGELCLAGVGLALEYLNQPERTAERFIDSPLPEEYRSRLYRTGDLARWKADGRIDFIGRTDHQVKIRGHRLELGEIESALGQIPGIEQSAVVAREDTPGDRRLVAYVVGSGEGLSSDTLREALRTRLPAFAVPSSFVRLDAMPLTANGKIDRRALPSPLHPTRALSVQDRLAQTPVQRITEIWKSLLGDVAISEQASFFTIGGDSLLAMRMIHTVGATFNRPIPVAAFFTEPTPAGLARLLAGEEAAPASGHALAATVATPAPPQPQVVARAGEACRLSFLQESLWYIEQLFPGSSMYHLSHVFTLRGPLDATRLQAAFQALCRRHDIYRTVFRTVSGVPHLHVSEACPAITVSPMAGPTPGSDAQVLEALGQRAREPFKLDGGLLVRAELVQGSRQEHLLLMVMHHAITDGWSNGLFLDELRHQYALALIGASDERPRPRLGFADYAHSQREYIERKEHERSLAFWRTQLEQVPVLALPLDFPRPERRTSRGERISQLLPGPAVQGLLALGQAQGATPFTTFLAAVTILLNRYTNQDRFLIGTPYADRSNSDLGGVHGPLINTLVLRMDLEGLPASGEVIERAQRTMREAMTHAGLPFEVIVRELLTSRRMDLNPYFQVMFLYLSASGQPQLRLDGLEVSGTELYLGTAKFDLLITVAETPAGTTCTWEFSTDLFKAASIRRMGAHFLTLIGAMAAQPETAIQALPCADAREIGWGIGEAWPISHDRCLHGLFLEAAARDRSAIAVRQGAHTLSYGELAERSAAVARQLSARGVRNRPVAVITPRCPEQVIAILGVMRAGGHYVPIDPDYPVERVASIVHQAGVALAITDSYRHEDIGCELLGLDVLLTAPAASGALVPPGVAIDQALPSDIAYVIFTSGSTGRPKGVVIDHRGAINTIRDLNDRFAIQPGDAVLGLSSVTFDLSVYDMFGIFAAGGSLVLPEAERGRDPAHWSELIERHRITLWNSVPAYVEMLIEHAERHPASRLDSVRLIWMSGDWIPVPLVPRIRARLPGSAVISMGGATEASIWSIIYPVTTFDATWRSVPYGYPMRNQSMFVLNQALAPCPTAVTGDIYIGGVGVALGYCQDQQRTSASFIKHPVTGERLYRTGDAGRWHEDGYMEFIGRTDHQVKIRGFRIELGEIESVLASDAQVKDCVALVREDVPGNRVLVAYVTSRDATAPALRSALVRLARERLPDYMVPADILVLDAMPLTGNGKVDRKSLPLPSAAVDEASQDHCRPTLSVHYQLISIWESLLQRPVLSIDDNFFALGGHSLLAMRLVDRIEAALGRTLPVATLYSYSTIRTLAERLLASGDGEQETVPPSELVRAGVQPALIFLHGDFAGGGFYSWDLFARLKGQRAVQVLRPHGTFTSDQPVPGSIRAMAEDQLAQIRALQPHGPYHLGGFCTAGLIALEIARRLSLDGEEVASLVLLDPPLYSRMDRWGLRLLYSLARLHGAKKRALAFYRYDQLYLRARRAVLLPWRLKLELVSRKLRNLFGWRAATAGSSPAPSTPAASGAAEAASQDPTSTRRVREVMIPHLWATVTYTPSIYRGPATIIFSTRGDDGQEEPGFQEHWRPYLPAARAHQIESKHLEMITMHTAELAGLIDADLAASDPAPVTSAAAGSGG